jgi:SAM-dependent methyltransferase
MTTTPGTNDEQAALWNGVAGHAWAETQQVLDQMFKPFEDLLVAAAVARSARHVLDVGCGTGATTLAIARQLGPERACLGIDISEPMLALARARAAREGAPARFLRADAQRHDFGAGQFDLIVSRFGVMFFDDPIRAFANLRRAASAGAELRCFAWRSPADNPFMTTAEQAAAPFLPNLPARRPNAPGQFAFADDGRVRGILSESGWNDIDLQPIDVACTLPENELVNYLTRLGPLGQSLPEVDEATRGPVIAAVRAAFDRFVRGTEVRFTAACWTIVAQA